MHIFILCFILYDFIQVSSAAVITYNWDVGWITANPDGRYSRPVIAINRKWPSPTITGDINDTIIVNVNNKLGNESLTIHWHGIFQRGNNANDGTPMVTQCPIIPGTSYTYIFELNQPGTYWYHSHTPSQYMDGLRGPLIIHDPDSPYAAQYDEELILTVSDWYHKQAANLELDYLSIAMNPWSGSEPVPLSSLMNDEEGPKFSIQADKTYFLRIINMSGFAQFYLHIDNHTFTVIEVDGVYTQPQPVQDIYIANSQRYGVLLRTKPNSSQNYAILGAMDMNSFNSNAVPPLIKPNVTGALVYDASKPIPSECPPIAIFDVFDDFDLVPLDEMPLLAGVPDQQIVLGLSSFNQAVPGNDQYRFGFNNITYIAQKVPSLYTVLSAGKDTLDPSVYGKHSNPIVLGGNNLVQLVVNNYDNGPHPIHIHGRNVQLIARSSGIYSPQGGSGKLQYIKNGYVYTDTQAGDFGLSNNTMIPSIPMRRDTLMVGPNSYEVFRYRADNPGTWILHCHMEWHMDAGLMLILIEDPLAIQEQQPNIPNQMQSICKAQSIPLVGNAAGNSQNYTDLTGEIDVAPLERGAIYPEAD